MQCDFEYRDGTHKCRRFGCPISLELAPDARIVTSCLGLPHWHEFGHYVELSLAAIYITKLGYIRLRYVLGLAPQCGCQQRGEKLNTLGHRFALFLSGLFGRLRSYLRAIDRYVRRSR